MTTFTVVDVVPQTHSGQAGIDNSEPSIAVNPVDRRQILISAFTSSDSGQTNGPLYVSQDAGLTWNMAHIVPGGRTLDQTYAFGGISGEFYGGDISGTSSPPATVILNALRAANPFVPGTMTILESPTPTDQPFIVATTVRYGPDSGKDRFYIGYNDQRATSQTAAIDVCLDAAAATPVISTVHLDTRTTAIWYPGPQQFQQDGPQVRTAVHPDGTIYATFNGVRTFTTNPGNTGNTTSDIMVVRDDAWASGASPFTALIDPLDGLAGIRVQTGAPLFWSPRSPNLGQERAFGCFAITTHPANSDIVYLAWAQLESGVQTLHVQRSMNRGANWSASLLSAANAINAALAISTTGKIGLLYQQLTGSGASQRWVTHFRDSTNGTTWTDTVVCTTPAATPPRVGLPYLGDYIELLAVGKNFYGTFCANNTPDPANFPATPAAPGRPNGARFVRNVTATAPWNLLGSNGVTVVGASIDPFVLVAEEVSAASDFYVRDWTDSPTSGDDGSEPSTHWDFWDYSDVWNQATSSVAFPPDPNDVPHSENAQAGADNYAFARIRRNQLPATGTGSTNVNAHFLVSEFGTGSNFVDNVYSDPSDPDVTFPNPDVQLAFAETALGPLFTPPTTWNLAATISDHLCLAVEISAPGDPMAAPGLTGRAPGQTGTTLSVVNDNNKAQRNLRVTPAMGGGGIRQLAIVHNAATLVRDIVLGLAVSPGGRAAEGTLIEVVSEKNVVQRAEWRPWGTLTLPAMQPGENRWIGVTLRTPQTGATSVSLTELKGEQPVNGFTVGTEAASPSTVIGWLLDYHRRVLRRLEFGFGVAAAVKGIADLDALEDEDGEPDRDTEGFNFREHVRVEEKDLRIEINVEVRRGGRAEPKRRKASQPGRGRSTPDATRYTRFARGAARVLEECLLALRGNDPFDIRGALTEFENAADATALTGSHTSALNGFDAYMTMLQKARGDRADILQMVLWHRDMTERSAALAALADTPAIVQRLETFVAQVEARTATLATFTRLLADLSPMMLNVSASLGASAELDPLIGALGSVSGARAQQKAYRELLLSLERFA